MHPMQIRETFKSDFPSFVYIIMRLHKFRFALLIEYHNYTLISITFSLTLFCLALLSVILGQGIFPIGSMFQGLYHIRKHRDQLHAVLRLPVMLFLPFYLPFLPYRLYSYSFQGIFLLKYLFFCGQNTILYVPTQIHFYTLLITRG